MTGHRGIFIAAGIIAIGWMTALAGEVVSQRNDRTMTWVRYREELADRDSATDFDRLRSSSWPGYVLSAVIAGYTSITLAGIPAAGPRAGRLRLTGALLCMLGMTVAAARFAGDIAWSLWEIAAGDAFTIFGYGLGLWAVASPRHIVRTIR